MKKFGLGFLLYILFFGLLSAQYYYFDIEDFSWYRQDCPATLDVKINTANHSQWARAGRLHLILDPSKIEYSRSSLRDSLFVASVGTFSDRSSANSPSWKPWSDEKILQIDRKNNNTNYRWTNWLYWTIKFTPKYLESEYSFAISMEYNWEVSGPNSTIETTLSAPWWSEIINPIQQSAHMTGEFNVLQKPCLDDINSPKITINSFLNWAIKQNSEIWLSISLLDNVGDNNVPYVWTGNWNDLIWTGNVWNLNNQDWIDIESLEIILSGNGKNYRFTWWVYAIPNSKTWQFLDKNYEILIPSDDLFDFGIEKRIDLSVFVKDRNWNQRVLSYSFNHPKWPELISNSRNPEPSSSFVNYDVPVKLWIKDDWAGVNIDSVVVTLSGISGTDYWPFVFSGNLLNFSWINGQANLPDQMIEIRDHKDFPASWTIRVSVDVQDMEWNPWNISDYFFEIRPSCSVLWCGDDKYVFYKDKSFVLMRDQIEILWWLNPLFHLNENWAGFVDCGLSGQWMQIYKWDEADLESGFVQEMWFIDLENLAIMWNKVKAVLSGSTLYLEKIFPHWSLDGGGWGWWSYLRKDYCPDGDFSPSYYDGICEWEYTHGSAKVCPIEDSDYSQELIDAFQFAYWQWITTMCPIETADLQWQLLRKHLAKMISEFAVTIVWLYPDINKEWCDIYDDMSDQWSEMIFFSKIACQLWLMGLESDWFIPQKSFNPDWLVSRAEFGTVLSRLVFGEENNLLEWENMDFWYKHLNALKKHDIMTKIENPYMIEMRWRVFLMLQRTFEMWAVDKYRLLNNAKNSIRIIYDF